MKVALFVMPEASATASICAMTSLTFMGASDFVSFAMPGLRIRRHLAMVGIVVAMAVNRDLDLADGIEVIRQSSLVRSPRATIDLRAVRQHGVEDALLFLS